MCIEKCGHWGYLEVMYDLIVLQFALSAYLIGMEMYQNYPFNEITLAITIL